jgi:hypothetical protein
MQIVCHVPVTPLVVKPCYELHKTVAQRKPSFGIEYARSEHAEKSC